MPKEEYGYDAMAPYTGGSYDLIADRLSLKELRKERLEERRVHSVVKLYLTDLLLLESVS